MLLIIRHTIKLNEQYTQTNIVDDCVQLTLTVYINYTQLTLRIRLILYIKIYNRPNNNDINGDNNVMEQQQI